MKRILIWILLVLVAAASGECPAQTEKIDTSSNPNQSKSSSNIENLLKEAVSGISESQYQLGFRYAKGQGVEQGYKEAVKWYRKSAEQGYAVAQYNLGFMYAIGLGVEQDYKEAFKWYRRAAEQENASAQFNLALMYTNGQGVEQDYKEAVKWFRKAAVQGDAGAQNSLGVRYNNGQGVEQDYKEAAKWFRKAAEQGYAVAQYNLGIMYAKGEGLEQDYKEAVKWYRRATEQGNATAQNNLGLMYANGQGVEQDYKEAVKWYRRAAEQGYAGAQYNLGIMYDNGQGVKQDYKEAVKWYRKAAEQGDAGAQYNLGVMYANGQGVEQDYKEAVKWYHKSAEQGKASAQYNLGIMYEEGKGIIEDYIEAYKWYLLAGMNGEDVSELKKFIQRKMTATQIAEAQRRAKAFVARKENRTDQDNEHSKVKTTGTGFFIRPQGYMLTSQHVIEDAKTIKVVTNAGIYPATVIHADSFNDIAILKVQGLGFRALSIISSREVKSGDKVFTIGFPNVGLQGFEPKYTEGVISSLSGAKDDPRYFQISTPIQPGNSGGPLINDKGKVVGIITARLSVASSLATSGTLPQNVNYALKSSYVRAFLEVVPKATNQPLVITNQSSSSRTEQIKQAQEAVALVLSYY